MHVLQAPWTAWLSGHSHSVPTITVHFIRVYNIYACIYSECVCMFYLYTYIHTYIHTSIHSSLYIYM